MTIMKNKDPPIAKSILKYTQKTDFFFYQILICINISSMELKWKQTNEINRSECSKTDPK